MLPPYLMLLHRQPANDFTLLQPWLVTQRLGKTFMHGYYLAALL